MDHHGKNDEPDKNTGEPISPENAANVESSLALVQSAAIPHAPPPPANPPQATSTPNDNTPPWKKKLEITAIFVAIGLLVVNIIQLTVYTRQAKDYEVRESARLVIEDSSPDVVEIPLKQAATSLISPLTGTIIKDDTPDFRFTVTVQVRNVGGSIAREISVRDSTGVGGRFDEKDILTPKPDPLGPSLAAGEKSTDLGYFIEVTNRTGLPESQFFARPRIPPDERPYRWFDSIIVVVSYKNIFGEALIETRCSTYVPNPLLNSQFSSTIPPDSWVMKQKRWMLDCKPNR
jgi:hypothetical protein